MSFRGRAQYEQNYRGRSQYYNNYKSYFRRENLEEHKIIEVEILEVVIEVTVEMKTLKEVEVDLEKDSIQVILEEMIKAVCRLRSYSRASTNRDRIHRHPLVD